MIEDPTIEDFKIGDRVLHERFGYGDVTAITASAVTVKFFDSFQTINTFDEMGFGLCALENLSHEARKSGGAAPVPRDAPRICGYCGVEFANWDSVLKHLNDCGPRH